MSKLLPAEIGLQSLLNCFVSRLLYFRTGVTQEDLTGKTWRLVGAPTQLSRTNSSVSLFSGGQSSGTPREKRHRSWTSLVSILLITFLVSERKSHFL